VKAFHAAALGIAALAVAGGAKADPWTGMHVGVNAGYGFDGGYGVALAPVSADFVPTFAVGQTASFVQIDPAGFIGGAQFGYDHRLGSSFVVGAEIDAEGATIGDNRTVAPFLTNAAIMAGQNVQGFDSVKQSTDWLSTLRARAGILASPDLLFYATAGLAVGDATYSSSISFPSIGQLFSGSASRTQIGGVVGTGAEFAVTDNIRVKGEYLLYNLGHQTVAINTVTPPGLVGQASARFRTEGNILRVGANWKF